MKPARLGLFAALAVLTAATPARAFDYLEHGFFSDRACLEAQRRLAAEASTNEEVAVRYLALSLFCPESWKRPYCAGGYKQLEGSLNRLAAPPAESGDYAMTLGDFAALPDHYPQVGPVKGFPYASRGLTGRALEWLDESGDAGGVLSDVAEDACETDLVQWDALEKDVAAGVKALEAGGEPPGRLLSSAARAEIRRGPHDPAGAYSFDNPQYLDLVLRNHHHFGARAFETFSGFHAAADEISSRSCEASLALTRGQIEDLADGLPEFAAVQFSSLTPDALQKTGCAVVAERVRRRMVEWSARADAELVKPVAPLLKTLAGPSTTERNALAARLVPHVMALVFEGSSLHFLQDGLSGGHLRIDRNSHGLEESRYGHDAESAHGVTTRVVTFGGTRDLVAWGDSYLLGAAPTAVERCDFTQLSAEKPAEVAACLLQRQRAMVVLTSTASLIDWALGGTLYAAPDGGCSTGTDARRFACLNLPVRPPHAAGDATAVEAPRALERADLPVPPPPFSYQSILVSTAVDAAGGMPELGVRAVFLSELGSRANWMTSYHFGLLTRLPSAEGAQLTGEFGYLFHFRWGARFLLNLGPYAYGGLQGLGRSTSTFAGLGPNVGTSVLPEGWIRMPLELTLSYRVPVRLLDSRYGFDRRSIRIDAHWIELSVGLAFL